MCCLTLSHIPHIGVQGGGVQQPPLEGNFSSGHFREKQVIFVKNHLIFGQALEKIFGQETAAPPPPPPRNETGPVRL